MAVAELVDLPVVPSSRLTRCWACHFGTRFDRDVAVVLAVVLQRDQDGDTAFLTLVPIVETNMSWLSETPPTP